MRQPFFAFDFKVLRESEPKVKVDGLIVTKPVTGIGDEDGGGQIVFNGARCWGRQRAAVQEIPAARSVSYTEKRTVPASAINQDFDNLWLALQSHGARSGGEIRLPLPEQARGLGEQGEPLRPRAGVR